MKKLFVLTSLLIFNNGLNAQQTGTITDNRDGKNYKTVVMQSGRKGDTKTWLAENLAATKFRNGDPITEAKSREEWFELYKNGKPAYCYFDYDINNKKYSVLYNWFAINDKRGLAPKDWRIANLEDWQSIQHYGEYEFEEGSFANNHSELMSTDFSTYYYSTLELPSDLSPSYFNPTNTTGFNAVPNGVFSIYFLPFVFDCRWWAVNDKKEAYSIGMSATQPYLHFLPELKPGSINSDIYQSAFPVRCVKN